ncbi:hydroxypyruvate isomerase family protein [Aureimonas frigidaquae]|uniref:hydroxypyruvate isomerase family protein n=1 Tax=Aureimonas frigidaquae TaxID=424757 RepID=UPI00078626AA|nr:TIM barrel protein [Aureimonas frigidaquae]
MRRYSAHLGYMFTEHALEDRFAAAAACGFRDVEHPGPYSIAAERIAGLCREHGLNFVQMALPAGDPARGEKGIACLPGREAEFREGVATGLAYAKAVGSRYVHVMSGLTPAGVAFDTVWSTYVSNLRFASAAGADAGIPVLIEPIGAATISGYLVDHPDIALRALDAVGAPNLSLLFDAFHATNAGVDPIAFVRKHHGLISHVHIADHPGRHEPGSGRFDFQSLFRALDAGGYAGSIGLEYVPAGDTAAGLGWRERFG